MQNISSCKSGRNITTMRYPSCVISSDMYIRIYLNIIHFISAFSSNSSQSLSLNLMSSSESKLEQDCSEPSDSFLENSLNKLAISRAQPQLNKLAGLRPEGYVALMFNQDAIG
ncbi:hypothetical protein TNCV_3847451 [Trichonephila clavipes]|nr:hypothetical protein TNCV_3847451 [Trichonephila clavipes]